MRDEQSNIKLNGLKTGRQSSNLLDISEINRRNINANAAFGFYLLFGMLTALLMIVILSISTGIK